MGALIPKWFDLVVVLRLQYPLLSWSGNTRSQSSQLAEPLWTDPGLKSGISARELILTIKKKKRAGEE